MKIRNGFVSNSSSSSFIVVFDSRPQTIEEVFKFMFPNNLPDTEIEYCDVRKTCGEIAVVVFKDLTHQHSATVKEIQDTIYGYGHDVKELDEYYKKWMAECEKINDWETKQVEKIKVKYGLERVYGVPENHNAKEEIDRLFDIVRAKEEKSNKVYEKQINKFANKFHKKNNGKFIGIFEYGDRNGETVLEHGDIFNNLDNIRLCKH